MFFIYLIFFLFAVFQATFLPLNLLLTAAVCISVIKVNKQTVLLLFLSGFIYDLFSLNLLGSTGLLLLLVSFLIFLYQRKIKTDNIYYLLVISVLIFAGDALFIAKNLSLISYLVEILISFPIFFLFRTLTCSSKNHI